MKSSTVPERKRIRSSVTKDVDIYLFFSSCLIILYSKYRYNSHLDVARTSKIRLHIIKLIIVIIKQFFQHLIPFFQHLIEYMLGKWFSKICALALSTYTEP